MPITDDDLIRLDPSGLTDEEIDGILDPNAIGVPELSPEFSFESILQRLRETADESDGAVQLGHEARYTAALSDPARSVSRSRELIEQARANGDVAAEAEAILAVLEYPAFVRGGTEIEDEDLYQRGIQLAAHTQDELLQADYLSWRAVYLRLRDEESDAIAAAWQARSLLLRVSALTPRAFAIVHILAYVFGTVAWEGDQNLALARRYFALSLLAFRRSDTVGVPGGIHVDLAVMHSSVNDLTRARAHARRGQFVGRHTGDWFDAARSLYYLCRIELDQGNREVALSLRDRFRHEEQQHIPESVRSMMAAVLDALVHFDAGQHQEGIERALEALDHKGPGSKTRIRLMEGLASAHEALDNPGEANTWLRRALSLQRDFLQSKTVASATGITLTDQIERLKEEFGEVTRSAARSASLLRGILPPSAYTEFQETGECKARHHESVALFYSDFAGFTRIASGMHPDQLVDILGELFGEFDRIMAERGCERVETIGDAYLAVTGIDRNDARTASERAADMVGAATAVSSYLTGRNREFRALGAPEFHARIGVHTGSIVGGLVGTDRVRYAVFGDAVNTAQRLEAGGEPGAVTVSAEIEELVRGVGEIALVERPPIPAKGKGELAVWEASALQPEHNRHEEQHGSGN